MKLMQEVKSYLISNSTGSVELTTKELEDLKTEIGLTDTDWKVLAIKDRKIDAIKCLRQQHGLGLKEAKDAVEAFMYNMKGFVGCCLEIGRSGVEQSIRIFPQPAPNTDSYMEYIKQQPYRG